MGQVVRAGIVVFGKVQGVFFRKHTSEKAHELRLKGFVRNQKDGTVYMEAEGDAQDVESMILWCHEGSPYSKVTHVRVLALQPSGSMVFEIQK